MQASRFRTKYTGIALLTLIVLTLAPISVNYAQNQDDKFKEIAERAKEKVEELGALIGETFDPGKTWPWDFTEEEFEEMTTAYEDAEDQNYKDAMKTYREVYRMLNMYAEAEGLTSESGEGEKAEGLLVAIDRANETIARIKDANDTYFELDPLAEDDLRETILAWINANLTYAESNLTEAYEAITLYSNVGWAEGNLTEARGNISDAFAALKSLAEWTNAWRIESFLMGLKKSVERTRERLERANGQDIDADFLGGLLDSAEQRIVDARSARTERNIRAAIEHANAIRAMLKEVHRGLGQQGKGGK